MTNKPITAGEQVKPADLRIGNYIRQGLAIIKVGAIETEMAWCKDDNNHTSWCHYENVTGIPLTPEWLEDFGFHKNPGLVLTGNSWEFPIKTGLFFLCMTEAVLGGTYFNLAFPGTRGGCYMPSFKQCQYVHQLQNLFFALTQTELQKIK